MNPTESFEKFTKRKTHESDNLPCRKGLSVNKRKKHSYSNMRDMKRKCED
jgi:hypothetical protein